MKVTRDSIIRVEFMKSFSLKRLVKIIHKCFFFWMSNTILLRIRNFLLGSMRYQKCVSAVSQNCSVLRISPQPWLAFSLFPFLSFQSKVVSAFSQQFITSVSQQCLSNTSHIFIMQHTSFIYCTVFICLSNFYYGIMYYMLFLRKLPIILNP